MNSKKEASESIFYAIAFIISVIFNLPYIIFSLLPVAFVIFCFWLFFAIIHLFR